MPSLSWPRPMALDRVLSSVGALKPVPEKDRVQALMGAWVRLAHAFRPAAPGITVEKANENVSRAVGGEAAIYPPNPSDNPGGPTRPELGWKSTGRRLTTTTIWIPIRPSRGTVVDLGSAAHLALRQCKLLARKVRSCTGTRTPTVYPP